MEFHLDSLCMHFTTYNNSLSLLLQRECAVPWSVFSSTARLLYILDVPCEIQCCSLNLTKIATTQEILDVFPSSSKFFVCFSA